MLPVHNRHTLAYRAAEAAQVMSWLKAGQSGCLIGLRGAGKSNFLRFLLRADVRQHYLGQHSADFALMLVDLLALTERAEWAVWELILVQLLAEINTSNAEPGTVEELTALHKEVMRTKHPLIARRASERCMALLCQRPTHHIALFLDNFDSVFGALDQSLFLGLRALRDAYKDRLSYVVAVADDLINLRPNIDEVEPFHQLVTQNICDLGPCSEADARQIIRYHASQRSLELSVDDTTRLIALSGGHPSLLKAILRFLWNTSRGGNLDQAASSLMDEPLVHTECRKVWDSLSQSEQIALRTLVDGTLPDSQMLERLRRRGLIRTDLARSPAVFSPLFVDFVRQQTATSPTRHVVINRALREVQLEGRRITTLTELEFEALCYLYEHRGQVCTKDDLITNVYRLQHERMKGGVTDETLQTLISRLRNKIEPDREPRYVVTVRGEGYRFVEPGPR